MKPIFELLTGEFVLFGNVIYNYIAMGIVGLIAFVIAFKLVGMLYDADIISSRSAGSFFHWFFRFVSFIVIFYILSCAIWLIKFIMAIQWWVWVIVGAIIIAAIVASVIRTLSKRPK